MLPTETKSRRPRVSAWPSKPASPPMSEPNQSPSSASHPDATTGLNQSKTPNSHPMRTPTSAP
jgi:hypothetical protein